MAVECSMRSHPYGRHGPHAWRKWHKRRYSRPSLLPVPVAPPNVIRVYVPVTAERIFFIIMHGDTNANHEHQDETRTQIEVARSQLTNVVSGSAVPPPTVIEEQAESPSDGRLKNEAQWRAFD